MFNIKPDNNIAFENLLGKNIEVAEKILRTKFKPFNSGLEKIYFSDFVDPRYFYKTQYNSVSLSLDEEGKIKIVSIHFKENVNQTFYDSFIMNYDEPSKILAIKSKKKIGEDVTNNYMRLSKGQLEMKEVELNENPLFVYWEKVDYNIRILNKKGNIPYSNLIFSLPTGKIK